MDVYQDKTVYCYFSIKFKVFTKSVEVLLNNMFLVCASKSTLAQTLIAYNIFQFHCASCECVMFRFI